MKLTATQIRSLVAIYRLSKNGVVRSSEIIGVPDSILTKAFALTEDEWKIMKSHSEIGSNIIKTTGILSALTK